MFALSTVTSIKAASVNTPPLSPGSGTASLSPHSPYSQKSPTLNGPPSPNGRMSPAFAPTLPAAAASPISPHGFQERVTSPPDLSAESPDEDLDDAVSPRIPFFEKIKDKLPNLDTTTAAKSTEPSPVSPTDSDSEYGGLAYADSDGDEDDEDGTLRSSPQPLPAAKPAEPPASSSVMGVGIYALCGGGGSTIGASVVVFCSRGSSSSPRGSPAGARRGFCASRKLNLGVAGEPPASL